ncbi:MAG: LPS export ABC transporter periplasmic protein LptC [Acidobacteriota bacterium]
MAEGTTLTLKDRLPLIVSTLSMVFLLGTVGVIVTTIIRRSRLVQSPPPVKAAAMLSDQIISITEGYRYTTTENGKRKFQLVAARDTSYADGRHELESLDLTAYAADGNENLRIFADHGAYRQDQGTVNLSGHVKVTNREGLEVLTESMVYSQKEDIASTDAPVQFKRGALSGSSTGAIFNAKLHGLALHKDVQVVNAPPEKAKDGVPVIIRGAKADFAENDGIIRFAGDVQVTQGTQSAHGETITGVLEPKTQKLMRIEVRGQSILRSEEPGKVSTIDARDMDFHFDETQHLKVATANGDAHAKSLEKDAPREIAAERLEATFVRSKTGSDLQTVNSQGRTTLKISPEPGDKAPKASDSVLEADSLKVSFGKDGKFMTDADAMGNAVMVMTPVQVTPDADRKRIRAANFKAHFYETGNIVESFVAAGGAVAEFEPLAKDSKRNKRTLSGSTMTGHVNQTTQEISDLQVEGDTKMVDGKREASATRALYTASTQLVALRGKPVVWDESARTNADEIDSNVQDQQSFARGRVRTTYYSKDTTGGAAPFKKNKAPVFLTGDRAVIRHREGAARYTGDVRAWQDDNFVSAETIELDNNERQMQAWTDVQSALYGIEREVEGGKKEVVPTFASSDQMTYRDETRVIHYEGKVKIRQGTDRIEAAVADMFIDKENKLTRMTASREVILTQPQRRGSGDQIEYTAANETAILTGNLAEVEDKERGVSTKGARLTMHLRDARIEVNDESGAKRVRTTHRIQR